MKLIATILLVLMTIVLITCGVLLWKRRKETGDYSRHIQALFSWVSTLFTLIFIFRTWAETTTADSAFLDPEHTFVPLLMQMTFFLYPLEVINPVISRTKVYALLFSPLLLLVFVGMYAGIEYTPIHTYADLWAHLGEFNVWFRLFALIVMLLYCFSLFLVPYDWRKSSVDRKFIMTYALGFCMIGILHFSIQLSHAYVLVLLHQVTWMAFFLGVAYYELKERLVVSSPKMVATPSESASPDSENNELWTRIIEIMESNNEWRNPDINLSTLSQQAFSNRTYVSESFKRHTGMTFNEYLAKRRIDYVAEELKQHPDTNIQELFIKAGYRHRSTAWRHFQKQKGISPTEYIESLR